MKEMITAYNNDVYTFEYRMDTKEKVTCKIPAPKGNQKCVKNIYWSVGNDVTVTATLSARPNSPYAIWETVKTDSALSPMVTAMKFTNTTNDYRYIHLWVVME